MRIPLSVVHCHGIHTDSLGHYLSGLGLLVALAKEWPSIRAAWREEHLVLVGQGLSLDAVERYLRELERWQTPYERWWLEAQKKDTKEKSSRNISRERSQRSLTEVSLLDAHIVGTNKNSFNPVLGTGGNIGKRDIAKLFSDAKSLISRTPQKVADWLRFTLTGDATVELPDLPNAGTWFVFANKTFNSGQTWYREGRISPWSALLAIEGALLLAGSTSRKLGSQARPYAAFPFIAEPGSPRGEGDIGRSKGEFWAPVWERPAMLVEVRELFQRGLARLGSRAAKAPHEFAIAAMSSGVDAGLREFLRYELRQTTSSQVYEAIPRQRISVANGRTEASRRVEGPSDADLVLQLAESGWLGRLPHEPRDSKQKWKFAGLRGPIEAAIIEITERPQDPQRWQHMLQLLSMAQSRIDRNESWRKRCAALPFLHPSWFHRAWPDAVPDEVRVAQSIASIGAGTNTPILLNIFGLKYEKNRQPTFPKARPRQAVWSSGDPVRMFIAIVHRRLVDANPSDAVPLDASIRCPAQLAHRFASGLLDAEMISRWIPPLALIEWSQQHEDSGPPVAHWGPMDGAGLLDAFFRPFFFPEMIHIEDLPLFADSQPHSGLFSRLFGLLQSGNLEGAILAAYAAYHALGARSVIKPSDDVFVNVERLAAAFLIPVTGRDICVGIRRWLYPPKRTQN